MLRGACLWLRAFWHDCHAKRGGCRCAARRWIIAPDLNAFRKANGKSPLAADARLARAAQAHASDMASKTYFSHTGQDGSSVGDRVKRQGYGYCFVAENIAQGQKGALQALAGWQKSAGHRKNMLSELAIHFGMAEANGYWVMVLGKTGC